MTVFYPHDLVMVMVMAIVLVVIAICVYLPCLLLHLFIWVEIPGPRFAKSSSGRKKSLTNPRFFAQIGWFEDYWIVIQTISESKKKKKNRKSITIIKIPHIWRFPIHGGTPQIIIHFRLGCFLTNHPALGVALWKQTPWRSTIFPPLCQHGGRVATGAPPERFEAQEWPGPKGDFLGYDDRDESVLGCCMIHQ